MFLYQDNKTSPRSAFWLPAALMALSGLILSFIALNPGTMSFDSFRMYEVGLEWQFDDWHHPFIPVLMALSRIIADDTSPLLFFQLAALWGGIYLYAISLRRQIGAWALLSILIGVTPVVLSQAGYMHKTPMQAALFLLVFGACYYYHTIEQRPPIFILFLLLLALLIGTAIRVYSYICVLSITMFLAYIVIGDHTIRFAIIKYFFISLSILMFFFVVEKFIVYKVLSAKKTYKSQIIFKYDLAGIIVNSGEIYGNRLLKAEYSTPESILKYYKEKNGLWRIIKIFKHANTKEHLIYLFDEWLTAIATNPRAYLKHRRHAISRSLGVNTKMKVLRAEETYKRKINKYRLKKKMNLLWILLKKSITSAPTILFKPWFWFAINVLSFVLSIFLLNFKRFSRALLPHVIIVSSGTLFFITYLFICLDNDLRFVYWGILATVFGAFGIIASLISPLFIDNHRFPPKK